MLKEQLQQTRQQQTGGNVQFLLLAIDALQQTRNPADLLERLAESNDVATYLLEQIDERQKSTCQWLAKHKQYWK